MTKRKTFAALLLAGAMAVLSMPTITLPAKAATEDANSDNYNRYYYSQLDKQAQKFYTAIASMQKDGSLATGRTEYNLVSNGVVTSADVQSYTEGTNKYMLTAFGAARDAFVLDNPEVFYVDFSQLSISAGTKDGKYIATMGTGRSDNYFIRDDDGNIAYSTESQATTAIATFNTAVDKIVNSITATTQSEKVKQVNKALIDSVTYTYTPANQTENPFIHTAYGGIVSGSAVCEGYAKSFKVIMDKLGVPCVLVQGNANAGTYDDPVWQAHMWNYVKLDNHWYGVDVTWNDTTESENKYLLTGSLDFTAEHSADGVVSSVGYEFKYPTIDAYDYGSDRDGFEYEVTESASGSTMADIKIAYNGKNVQQLEAEGLYFAIRTSTVSDGNETWTPYGLASVYDPEHYDGYSLIEAVATSFKHIQFAVFDHAPSGTNYETSEQPVNETREIENGTFGTYVAAPYAISTTPGVSGNLDPEQTYEATIVYDEVLKKVSGEDIKIEVNRRTGGAWSQAKIENIKWDGKSTITFTFTPDPTYGAADQLIKVSGLVGKDSEKTPNDVAFRFTRKAVVCSKVYNDGRLWMSVYGTPTPIADKDLSLDNWTQNGQPVSSNQRSQLMLVASKPSKAQSDSMLADAAEDMGIEQTDIMSSATFDIDLVLCGCVQTIPSGSYMKVAFGFPEGYGPEDAGTTFKLYHYQKDASGNITSIDEIPCVVTAYGLVATVTSFSPYAVVAVDSSKVADGKKTVYAEAIGEGTVTSDANIIAQLSQGESITYNITPNDGYEVEAVLVNGTRVEVTDNKITLTYDELNSNNTVEVYFVATSVKTREAAEGITNVFVARQTITANDLIGPETSGNNAVAIAVVVILALVIIGGLAAILSSLVVKNKRSAKE